MRNVDDPGLGADVRDHAVAHPDEVVTEAVVGQEGDDRLAHCSPPTRGDIIEYRGHQTIDVVPRRPRRAAPPAALPQGLAGHRTDAHQPRPLAQPLAGPGVEEEPHRRGRSEGHVVGAATAASASAPSGSATVS